MKAIVGALSLALLLSACGKPESPSPEPPKADAVKPAEQAAAPAASPLDPKLLLTDEMIGKYVVYQRAMLPVMGDAMAMGAKALQESSGSQADLERKMAADERSKKIEAATKEAEAKSGLSMRQATELAKLVSDYIPKRTIGTEEDKQKARAEFEQTYGAAAAAAMDKHEAELSTLQDEMLKAALGPAKK